MCLFTRVRCEVTRVKVFNEYIYLVASNCVKSVSGNFIAKFYWIYILMYFENIYTFLDSNMLTMILHLKK